jgi:hypothetical protein
LEFPNVFNLEVVKFEKFLEAKALGIEIHLFGID